MAQFNPEVFQDRINEILERGEFSQRDLAEKFGVNQSTISRWASGKTTPKPGKFRSETLKKTRQQLQTAKRRERRRQEKALGIKAKTRTITTPAPDTPQREKRTPKVEVATEMLTRHNPEDARRALELLGRIQAANNLTNAETADLLNVDVDTLKDIKEGMIWSGMIDDIEDLENDFPTEPQDDSDIPF